MCEFVWCVLCVTMCMRMRACVCMRIMRVKLSVFLSLSHTFLSYTLSAFAEETEEKEREKRPDGVTENDRTLLGRTTSSRTHLEIVYY